VTLDMQAAFEINKKTRQPTGKVFRADYAPPIPEDADIAYVYIQLEARTLRECYYDEVDVFTRRDGSKFRLWRPFVCRQITSR
jgi:hypothetical protein